MNIKPIRNDDDLTLAFVALERVFQAENGTPEADERDILLTLIEAYEAQHYPIASPSVQSEHLSYTDWDWHLASHFNAPTINMYNSEQKETEKSSSYWKNIEEQFQITNQKIALYRLKHSS